MKTLLLLFKRDLHNLEYDAPTQYKFHLFWAWFWFLQMPAVVVLLLVWPRAWAAIAIVYLTLASLWANFATHFGAMSASLAAKHAAETPTRQDLLNKLSDAEIVRPELPQTRETVADDIASGLLE